jgi:hypothetical protein
MVRTFKDDSSLRPTLGGTIRTPIHDGMKNRDISVNQERKVYTVQEEAPDGNMVTSTRPEERAESAHWKPN